MSRIDLLGVDGNGNPVVIELEAGVAGDQALGQILNYIGWIEQDFGEEKHMRGIIVANDFDEGLKAAVATLPPISLKRNVIEFRFQDVS